ncbi:hypothetical protein WOLCODRAFT_161281 [Wolfiporia cocos MD-104 SS10]|uniref:Protein transport protein sec16 n=1 Tax=Wolfiporia cocos (strain MD-104) TaxID=742152 RepID=A0A2H3J8W8_WOLCO|nr:hypothetical protein WOLCODRAFT_161281 [Wolfiporia cocos MD-104 SS10]
MDTAGEAASLFGTADSAADLFSASNDGTDNATLPAGGGNEHTHEQSPAAADLFGANQDSTDFFGAAGTMDFGASGGTDAFSSWSNSDGPQQEYSQSTGASQTAYVNGGSSYYSQQYQPDPWHAQTQQGTSYVQSRSQAGSAYGTYQPASQSSLTYDPYASHAPADAPSMHSVNQAQGTSSMMYDPYKPPAPTTSNAYAPAPSTQPVYDPYRPAQTNGPGRATVDLQPSYAYPSVTSNPPTVQSPAAVPPPSAPSTVIAAAYRPKTTNAYDPPLPPPKQSRKVSVPPSYTISPPGGRHLTVSTPPPPPPRSPPRRVQPNTEHYAPFIPPQAGDSVASEFPQTNGPTFSPHARYDGLPYTEPHANPPANPYDNGYDAVSLSQFSAESGNADLQAQWNDVLEEAVPSRSPPSHFSYLPAAGGEQSNSTPSWSSGPDWTDAGSVDAEPIISHALPRDDLQLQPPMPAFSQQPADSFPNHALVHLNEPTPDSAPDTLGAPLSQARSKSPPISASPRGPYTPITNGHTYNDPYAPPAASRSPERGNSPASVRSVRSAGRQSLDQGPSHVATSPPMTSNSLPREHVSGHSSSYEPAPSANARRAASPASIPSASGSASHAYNPYVPANNRNRSTSNGSAFSSISAVLEDPYAPANHVRQQPSNGPSRGSLSQYDRPPAINGSYVPRPAASYDAGQVLSVPPPTQSMYAPSPSLLGANDPLGRTSVRVPVISFGFGGKLVTCFHGASMNTGFDVALASRQSTDIKLYTLHKIIPESALDTSAVSYPGPLFSDPGTPTTSLVRTASSTQTKTKKARVVKYLEERADEISRGIGYFHQGSLESRRAEAKHLLVNLLKVMVENDGKLSGSPQIESAVRAVLVPRLSNTTGDSLKPSASLSAPPADFLPQSPGMPTSPYISLTASAHDQTDALVATHTVRSSDLDKIQGFLLRGDRRAACHYASDEKLWAHAMVIASSIDKDTWKEVVTEFVRGELANNGNRDLLSLSGAESRPPSSDGHEALRVAYSLFAGQGPASVKELLPPKPLIQTQTLQLPSTSVNSTTPMSASFPAPAEPLSIPIDALGRWADTVAMIYTSPMTLEISSTLTALGDQLAANHWYEAAHTCYLLSPQTSPMGGIGSSSRIILVGSHSPSVSPIFAKDTDPIIFSEIAEFAMSLSTPAKGQEAFAGLPHLQPYRLIRAVALAEMGHVQLAHRYCEAISSCLNRFQSYANPTFVEQLRGLSDRLTATPQLDKTGSWIGSKVSKPSLDTIGNWLEGRLTKFIAGEADSPRADETPHPQHQQAFTGPFAHYSTISSTASSAVPSPHQSRVDLTEVSNSPPPFRTGSAMAYRPPPASHVQINRSSSAMDYVRPSMARKPSPVPRVSSASAMTSSFADTSLYSQALNGHAFGMGSKQNLSSMKLEEEDNEARPEQSNGPAIGTWWGSSESAAPTPTASSFARTEENTQPDSSSGFISLMDDPAFSVTPTAPSRSARPASFEEDEEDDLGLGNASHRVRPRNSDEDQNTDPAPAKESKPEPTEKSTEKPELKTASSGSWLSRLWKRESTPAPAKANLGEQTSFYYDKELKRWVNKNTSAEAAKPTAPPPPPRAQTASPGRSQGSAMSGMTPPPPPARPATANAFESSGGPPKPPMRVRSNLVPEEANGSAPPTPMSATMPITPGAGPPPPGGRTSRQAKRPVRNRYVDVFQQQAGAS